MKKGTKLYSILHEKCPHCHEGEFFEERRVYKLKNVGKVYRKCQECGGSFFKEPGFYYGAMYVSYGYGVAMFVGVALAVMLFYPDPEPITYAYFLAPTMVILGPWLYKLSRITWANLFFHYKGNTAATEEKAEA